MIKNIEQGLELFKAAVVTLDKYTFATLTLFLFVVVYTLHIQNLDKSQQIEQINHDLKMTIYSCDSERISSFKLYYQTLNKLEHDRDSLKYYIRFKINTQSQ